MRQVELHGWKFKPAKTEFGFEEIVAVGARYRNGTISIVEKLVDAVQALCYLRTLTEVRSILGLFNQFRERVLGYALRIHALTQLTRTKPKDATLAQTPASQPKDQTSAQSQGIAITVEAAEEFKAMQRYLLSPAVLVVFRHGRRTFVYTDASLGTPTAPGEFGTVITQLDPADGKEYVCAFASAGLTPAQRNYQYV